MDFAAAFLLSLLGGYCFAYVWRGTRFTTRPAPPQELVVHLRPPKPFGGASDIDVRQEAI
jgi:hypothetical protein